MIAPGFHNGAATGRNPHAKSLPRARAFGYSPDTRRQALQGFARPPISNFVRGRPARMRLPLDIPIRHEASAAGRISSATA